MKITSQVWNMNDLSLRKLVYYPLSWIQTP